MTVLVSPVAVRSSSSSLWFSLRRNLAWHPEWWVYAVAAGAWLVLGWMALQTVPHVHGFVAAWSSQGEHWLLMVLAMMLPVVAPHVRTVGLRSLWSRRHRSATVFVLAYLAVWALIGALLVAGLVAAGLEQHGQHLLPGALLLAAAWQVSPPRRRVLRRCAPVRLGAPAGAAADADCARAGARSGLRCLVECGPVMLAMAVSHSLVLMAGLTVVLLSERARGANPVGRAGRPLEAWVLAGFAGVALLTLA